MNERQERFALLLLRWFDACENGVCTSEEAMVGFTLAWDGEHLTPPHPQKKWLADTISLPKVVKIDSL